MRVATGNFAIRIGCIRQGRDALPARAIVPTYHPGELRPARPTEKSPNSFSCIGAAGKLLNMHVIKPIDTAQCNGHRTPNSYAGWHPFLSFRVKPRNL